MKEKALQFSRCKSIEESKKIIDGVHSNVLGTMGEFYGISALPNIKSASTLISEMPVLADALRSKMAQVLEQAKKDPHAFEKLEEQFPNLFHSSALQNQFKGVPDVSLEKKVDYVHKWILSKEIDLVRVNGAEETWLEIKTKRNPMTLNDFMREAKGMKAPLRQIMEDREILEFLGLQDRIKLEYLVTAGIQKDLHRALREMGIKPLEFKDLQH